MGHGAGHDGLQSDRPLRRSARAGRPRRRQGSPDGVLDNHPGRPAPCRAPCPCPFALTWSETMTTACKITLPASHKLGPCCHKDHYRFALNHAVLYPADTADVAFLLATDGRVCAVLPVPVSAPDSSPLAAPVTPRPVPAAALTANGRDVDVVVNGEVRVSTPGSKKAAVVLPLPESDPDYQGGRFPAIQAV